jgi:hypothetical protein
LRNARNAVETPAQACSAVSAGDVPERPGEQDGHGEREEPPRVDAVVCEERREAESERESCGDAPVVADDEVLRGLAGADIRIARSVLRPAAGPVRALARGR